MALNLLILVNFSFAAINDSISEINTDAVVTCASHNLTMLAYDIVVFPDFCLKLCVVALACATDCFKLTKFFR